MLNEVDGLVRVKPVMLVVLVETLLATQGPNAIIHARAVRGDEMHGALAHRV
ncbi:MAG TPA: hypothetical protein VI756_19030 [Blastocatellia bacterium]